jgi:hypothetical protein
VNIYFVSLYLHGHTKNKKWLIRADRSRVEEVTKIEKHHCFSEVPRGSCLCEIGKQWYFCM